MCSRTTPMNLNQGSNEKIRKTHRSICDKGMQKCTSHDGNGVQVRDGPNRMARNSEKQIINLGQHMRSDPRISTPLNGSTSQIWHNVIEWRRLIIRIYRMLYLRHPKSRGHYRRSNGRLFTLYPITWRSVLKLLLSRGLVKMSASWCSAGIYSRATIFLSTRSLIKWYLISMCLVLECWTWFLEISITL